MDSVNKDCTNCGKLFTHCKILKDGKFYCTECMDICDKCKKICLIFTKMDICYYTLGDSYTSEVTSREIGALLCKKCYQEETSKVSNENFVSNDPEDIELTLCEPYWKSYNPSKKHVRFFRNGCVYSEEKFSCKRCTLFISQIRDERLVYYKSDPELKEERNNYGFFCENINCYSIVKKDDLIPVIICRTCFKDF